MLYSAPDAINHTDRRCAKGELGRPAPAGKGPSLCPALPPRPADRLVAAPPPLLVVADAGADRPRRGGTEPVVRPPLPSRLDYHARGGLHSQRHRGSRFRPEGGAHPRTAHSIGPGERHGGDRLSRAPM